MSKAKAYRLSDVVDGIQLVECDDVIAFVSYIDDHHRETHGVIWRGHSTEGWLLESTLERAVRLELASRDPRDDYEYGRLMSPGVVSSTGATAFYSFKQTLGMNPDFDSRALTDHDVWALGRHHGLNSLLLDWTKSPYVAAFFAFAELGVRHVHSDIDHVELWGLSCNGVKHGRNRKVPANDYRFEMVNTLLSSNRRMIAQQGVLSYVWPPIPIQELVKRRAEDRRLPLLFRVRIPHSQCPHFLTHLNRMSISYRTLYPDMEGACRHANFNMVMPGYEGLWGEPEESGFGFLKAEPIAAS